jgi:hypothetical protein
MEGKDNNGSLARRFFRLAIPSRSSIASAVYLVYAIPNSDLFECVKTVGAAFGAKRLVVDSQAVTLGIWVRGMLITPVIAIMPDVKPFVHCRILLGQVLYQQPSPSVWAVSLTAHVERYESMSKIYYRQAKAAIVCFGAPCSQLFFSIFYFLFSIFLNVAVMIIFV